MNRTYIPACIPAAIAVAASGCALHQQRIDYRINNVAEIRNAPHLMAEGSATSGGVNVGFRIEQWDKGAHTGRCEATILAAVPGTGFARIDATDYSGKFGSDEGCDFNHQNVSIYVQHLARCTQPKTGCARSFNILPEESYISRLASERDLLTEEVNRFFAQSKIQRVSGTVYRGFGR